MTDFVLMFGETIQAEDLNLHYQSTVHPSCKRSRKFRVGWVDGNTFYMKRMHYFPKISSKGFGLAK